MAGDTLPSKANIAKIAKYFGVTEGDLLANQRVGGQEIEDVFQPFVEKISKSFISSVGSIEEGVYFLYLPVENRDDICLRGLVLIWKNHLQTRFSRLIMHKYVGKPSRYSTWERYDGMVTERDGVTTFLAYLRHVSGDMCLSFAKVEPGTNGRLLSGISLTSQRGHPVARRIVAEYAGKRQQLLSLARRCGYLPVDDPDIDYRIRTIITGPKTAAPFLLPPF